MYVAALHYILGVRPTLDGLVVEPCLPSAIPQAKVMRRYRGKMYEIVLEGGREPLISESDGPVTLKSIKAFNA